MKTTSKNPLHTHPELALAMRSTSRKDFFFSSVIMDFRKDFKVLTTYEKLTPSKIYQFYIQHDLSPKNDLMWAFIDGIGGYINEYGEPSTSTRDFLPDNAFYRKGDFLKALKSDVLKVFVIQKRCDLKTSRFNRKYYTSDFKLSRFKQVKNSSSYYSLAHYNKYISYYSQMDKSGYNLREYKTILAERLTQFKQERNQQKLNDLKNKNHIENTKKALLKLFENAKTKLYRKVIQKIKNNEGVHIYNWTLGDILKDIKNCDQTTSIKSFSNNIRYIIKDIKGLYQ